MRKQALLYDRLEDNKVQCNICQRRCVIPSGQMGYCSTRLNENGKLYSLIYGEVSTWRVAPIEIKPLFHFYPGSHALSFGTLGCNFRCIGCQNWEIAHVVLKGGERVQGTEYISPKRAVELARQYNCQGLSWTYNEPTIWFEYTLDSARLAKGEGFYTNYVTNGFITEEALDEIGPYLDAFRVDVKGFSSDFYKKIAKVEEFRGILKVTELAKKKWNMHVEVITNIIPGYSDDEGQLRGIARWIFRSLGEDTPWHVTRFVPHLKLSHLPFTPVKTLERAREIGMEEGLRFVYLGNVSGHPFENTYCPSCGKMLIERHNYRILAYNIKGGRCKYCGERIPGHY